MKLFYQFSQKYYWQPGGMNVLRDLWNITYRIPDWASPGNWLGPEGHADLNNLVNDPSLYKLCILPLKLFNVGAVTASSLNLFHWFIILSKNVNTVNTRFFCNFRECPLVIPL